MKKFIQLISLFLLVMASQAANAAINVFACEPEWGALAKQLGGDKVNVLQQSTV